MKKQFLWRLIKFFSNLKTAITLLLLIACYSSLGTIIEQSKSFDFYELHYPLSNPLFGIISWKLIKYLELDHVYTAKYFLFLVFFFTVSLISCTFSTQLPILKISKKWQFYKYRFQFNKIGLDNQINLNSISSSISLLNTIHYSVFQQRNQIYSYKGLIGKFSPIIVHLSIILIFIGAVFSSFTGFMLQEIIPKGEFFHFQNIINSGQFSIVPQNLFLKVNDFWIKYNDDGSTSQFFSYIKLYNSKNQILKSGIIYVNKPLIYKGIYIYQTDWDISAMRLQIGNSILQIPCKLLVLDNGTRLWSSYLPSNILLNRGFLFIFSNLNNDLSVYDSDKNFLFSINQNQLFYLSNIPMRVVNLLSSTGLQIKSDSGLFIVYFGFLFLIISTFLSYISYSQIWLSFYEKNSFIVGTSNRAFLQFEEDLWLIKNFAKKLYKY
uniref:c-type cytochrome biogenensis protein n=1 Tax=Pulvinaster venetus TaxID=427767 RepID=UPI001FCDB8AE|nr:c-type cytochrome biogenensis protein [Pulvinaster venetus]UNJ17048.1 c-type cytochrome biogenensis protein [Pulvinaster venetus]